MTYTYAILEVSRGCWEEIQDRLRRAGHFSGPFSPVNDGEVINLHGLALRVETEKQDLMMITPPPGAESIPHLELTPFPKGLFQKVREKYGSELDLDCPQIKCEGGLEIFTTPQEVRVFYLACRLCGWSAPAQNSVAEVFRDQAEREGNEAVRKRYEGAEMESRHLGHTLGDEMDGRGSE